MKILFVPYGTDKAPATRYRVEQYLPYLQRQGIDYRVFSAISRFSTFLMVKSSDFAPFAKVLYYIYVFAERLIRFCYIISVAGRFDIIFLQRATFPFNLEILLRMANSNIVFDIDDAIYLPDKQGQDALTRIKGYIKKREVVGMLKVSKNIIVENEYIKNFVLRYCENVSKISGPIDIDRFFAKGTRGSKEVVIGWIGSPATTSYLHMLDNVLKAIKEKYNFMKFKFIGVGRYKNPDIGIERVPWDYKTEVKNLQSFDIGIMPMPDNEWTRGKLGCKMLQYMAVGVPAVVSYTTTNAEIIKDGINGFMAGSEKEWFDKLSLLIENPERRRKIGFSGREFVEKRYSLNINAPKFINILRRVSNQKV